MDIAFLLNGERVELLGVDPTATALDWLRDTRGLTGTKEGCNEGDCGACTVMLTDHAGTRAVNACLTMLPQLHGKSLTTIEGLRAPDGTRHPAQDAMVEHHASQCGFCTPGVVMSLAAGQITGEISSEADADRQLAGNLCRCTGYAPIARAAKATGGKPVPKWLRERAAGPEFPQGWPAFVALPASADQLAQYYLDRPEAVLIAGATDVALWVNKAMRDLPDVVFISQIEELGRIETAPYMIRIGAVATVEALRRAMAGPHPALAAMLGRFASAQVRSVATVGGNIANGSPIGDIAPAFIALGAELLLRRGEERREMALEDFFIDYGKQDRAPGEFVEAIMLPRDPEAGPSRLKVFKLSKRFDQDISAVLGAFNIEVDGGKVVSARIAFGGMAGIPKRADAMERALIGKDWTRATVETAMSHIAEDFTPMSDMRASASYRLTAAANMLMRCWREDQGEAVDLGAVRP